MQVAGDMQKRALSRERRARESPISNPCPVALQLASGEVYGKDQPIALQLLGSERSKEALEGVAMELEDSLYPLLREVSTACHYLTASLCQRYGDLARL